MDTDLVIPGPRTKSALALEERKRRRHGQDSQSHRIVADPEPHERVAQRQAPLHAVGRPCGATIREVSARTGLTLRAIRLYEEMGLLTCMRGTQNMRVLDAEAQARLQDIVELKSMGLTISEIVRALSQRATDPQALRRGFEARLKTIDRQRMAIAAYLSRLSKADAGAS